MKEYQEYVIAVNGFAIKASYSIQNIEEIWKPLINYLREIYKKKKHRVIVFLVAPPAVGKSTLSQFIELLSKEDGKEMIQSLGMDGFHFTREYLAQHTLVREGKEIVMNDVKGCPETFDIDELIEMVKKLKKEDVVWPLYDRNLHDVVQNQIHVKSNIVLIEGNWLLLKDEKWSQLRNLCDYSIQIFAKESMLKDRLIARKVKGGMSLQEATSFYENSDQINVRRVLEHSFDADLKLVLKDDLFYEKYKEE